MTHNIRLDTCGALAHELKSRAQDTPLLFTIDGHALHLEVGTVEHTDEGVVVGFVEAAPATEPVDPPAPPTENPDAPVQDQPGHVTPGRGTFNDPTPTPEDAPGPASPPVEPVV